MAATWKGHLQIDRLSIPISLSSVVDSRSGIHGTMLHTTCGNPISQVRRCNICDVSLSSEEVQTGYKVDEDTYVVLTPEDLERIKPASTKVISIEGFTKYLDPTFIHKPYYINPQGPAAIEALTVLRKAQKSRVALGRVCLRGKEYRVAIAVMNKGFVLFTLQSSAAVRPQPSSVDARVDKTNVELASRLVDQMNIEDPQYATYEDEYEESLKSLLEAKARGKKFVRATQSAASIVGDMREALEASLKRTA